MPLRVQDQRITAVKRALRAQRAQAGGKLQMADPGGVWIDVTDE